MMQQMITIREAFESFGQVTSARVIKDKYNGQSRGFGFVEMFCTVSGSNGH